MNIVTNIYTPTNTHTHTYLLFVVTCMCVKGKDMVKYNCIWLLMYGREVAEGYMAINTTTTCVVFLLLHLIFCFSWISVAEWWTNKTHTCTHLLKNNACPRLHWFLFSFFYVVCLSHIFISFLNIHYKSHSHKNPFVKKLNCIACGWTRSNFEDTMMSNAWCGFLTDGMSHREEEERIHESSAIRWY